MRGLVFLNISLSKHLLAKMWIFLLFWWKQKKVIEIGFIWLSEFSLLRIIALAEKLASNGSSLTQLKFNWALIRVEHKVDSIESCFISTWLISTMIRLEFGSNPSLTSLRALPPSLKWKWTLVWCGIKLLDSPVVVGREGQSNTLVNRGLSDAFTIFDISLLVRQIEKKRLKNWVETLF